MGKITINTDSLRTGRTFTRFKVEENAENIYRILPPFGDVSVHNNCPYKYWALVYMFDPVRGKRVPFVSPRTSYEPCPVTQYLDALGKRIAKYKAALEEKKVDAAKIKDILKPLNEVMFSLNVSGTYSFNACNKSGEIGILEVKSTAHKALKKKMLEYIKELSQDPTSMESQPDDSGVWFKFTRSGKGMDTEYGCDFNSMMIRENGRAMQVWDQQPLPQVVIDNYAERGYDIYNLHKAKSAEDLKDILMYNLSLIKDTVPQAIFGEWDPDAYFEKKGVSISKPAPVEDDVDLGDINVSEDMTIEEPPLAVEKVKGTKPVMLSIEDEPDDVQAAPASASAKPAATRSKPKAEPAPELDLFAEADAILNS